MKLSFTPGKHDLEKNHISKNDIFLHQEFQKTVRDCTRCSKT